MRLVRDGAPFGQPNLRIGQSLFVKLSSFRLSDDTNRIGILRQDWKRKGQRFNVLRYFVFFDF